MKKQAVIIGLGQFGMSMARALTERGVEVLAVDTNPVLVQAASFAAEAVSFDAMDEAALARTAPDRRDVCVCAIGEESREALIICTALLRQMGAKRIVARATDALTERILRLVGAHEVVNPERQFGERLASRLLYEGILEEVPLGEDLVITELKLPQSFIGRTLGELELPRKFGLTVAAIRRFEEAQPSHVLPHPNEPLRTGDVIVVVAKPGAAVKLLERI